MTKKYITKHLFSKIPNNDSYNYVHPIELFSKQTLILKYIVI